MQPMHSHAVLSLTTASSFLEVLLLAPLGCTAGYQEPGAPARTSERDRSTRGRFMATAVGISWAA